MKSPSFTITKILILSGIIFLISLITIDLSLIYSFNKEKVKLQNYIDFELTNIGENQQSTSDFIDILIQFKDAELQEIYLPFLNSTSKDLKELDILSRRCLENGDIFLGKKTSSDIENIKTKISTIQNPKLIDFYLMLAKTKLLNHIHREVFGSSTGGFNNASVIKPFNKDSAYIGRKGFTDNLSKLTFKINGQGGNLYNNHCRTYSIPISDTLRISTSYIVGKYSHVDAFSHLQTIAYINGGWKYIGSD